MLWRVDRAVECTGLENRRALTGPGGSNPPLSANFENHTYFCVIFLLVYQNFLKQALNLLAFCHFKTIKRNIKFFYD